VVHALVGKDAAIKDALGLRTIIATDQHACASRFLNSAMVGLGQRANRLILRSIFHPEIDNGLSALSDNCAFT